MAGLELYGINTAGLRSTVVNKSQVKVAKDKSHTFLDHHHIILKPFGFGGTATTWMSWMRTVCERSSRLSDLHHKPVPVGALHSSMATYAWLTAGVSQQPPKPNGLHDDFEE